METLKKKIKRQISILVLFVVYGISYVVSKLSTRLYGEYKKDDHRCVLVIGTFHNPNWYHAHIRPLAYSLAEKIVLVCDQPVDALESVIFECPPEILSKMLSRALSKFVWGIYCAIKYKPDLCMGYHIFPAAVTALLVARLINKPACYQDTSGPLELEGGGWHAENKILVGLGYPSQFIQKMAFSVVKCFDVVVVRGNQAKNFIRALGYTGQIEIITGSVETNGNGNNYEQRDIDLAFVGRLTEYKRPDRFLEILRSTVGEKPHIKAVICGEGPDRKQMEEMSRRYGLEKNLSFLGKRKDILEILGRTKIYVLTSRWEGLSIAMLEAMTVGAVPIVSRVGDLSDVIENGVNGYIFEGDDYRAFVDAIAGIVDDKKKWLEMSGNAGTKAEKYSGINEITRKWDRLLAQHFGGPMPAASGDMQDKILR